MANAMKNPHALPSTLGFIRYVVIDGFCRQRGFSINSKIKILMKGQNTNFSDTLLTGSWPDGAGEF